MFLLIGFFIYYCALLSTSYGIIIIIVLRAAIIAVIIDSIKFMQRNPLFIYCFIISVYFLLRQDVGLNVSYGNKFPCVRLAEIFMELLMNHLFFFLHGGDELLLSY